MLSRKGLIPAILLSCYSSVSYAQIDVSITSPSTESSSSIHKFDISVTSDVKLKYIQKNEMSAEYCQSFFYLYKPELINSTTYSSEAIYNHTEHQWLNGENLCLFIEDENGQQFSFSSQDAISLAPPHFIIKQAESKDVASFYEKIVTQGFSSNIVEYVYQPKNLAETINFELSGEVESGYKLTLTDLHSDQVVQQVTSVDGQWQFESLPISVANADRFTSHRYEITGKHQALPGLVLFKQPLNFTGKYLPIDILQKPQDPIDETLRDSGVARWFIDSPVNIVSHKVLMLADSAQCQGSDPVSNIVFDINNQQYDFLGSPEAYGLYACLQVEDDLGNLFTQDIGWIRKVATPEIIINDDIDSTTHYSDRFDGYATGAENLSLFYLKDNGHLSREQVLSKCERSNSGIPVDPTSFTMTISDASLHDHYACLVADNGNGGKSHWMSEHKINIHNGLEARRNTQPRYDATPYPTNLAIPETLQNSTLNNLVCRSVLLSDDLILTSGHCITHTPDHANGVWPDSPRQTAGYVIAKDEKAHDVYNTLFAELYSYYENNRENDESLTVEWLEREAAQLNDLYSKYKRTDIRAYFSPYFGTGTTSAATFADFVLLDLATPYDGDKTKLSFPQPLVYTHPHDIHLTAGEFRSHGSSDEFPMSGWLGGTIHATLPPGGNSPQYVLIDTVGGESGSALWAYDSAFDTYGVIGTVRGGGAWSSVWNHGRVTRQALAHSRAKSLDRRRDNYQGSSFDYRDLRRAVAKSDVALINKIIDSGVNVNLNNQGQYDGWMLARAIDIAVQTKNKLLKRETTKRVKKYQLALNTIETLMLGGADPRLTVSKPTRFMEIESGDSVLHYAVRTDAPKVLEAIWLNTTNFDYESISRQITNDAGDTPLHIAIDEQVDLRLFKLLFTDVGQDLYIKDAQGKSSLETLLVQESINDKQVSYIDWIGKAYSYEPIQIDHEGNISHQDWLPLLCHNFDYQGASYSFNEFAKLRSGSLTPQAVAAITRLGNRSGVDASRYCQ